MQFQSKACTLIWHTWWRSGTNALYYHYRVNLDSAYPTVQNKKKSLTGEVCAVPVHVPSFSFFIHLFESCLLICRLKSFKAVCINYVIIYCACCKMLPQCPPFIFVHLCTQMIPKIHHLSFVN